MDENILPQTPRAQEKKPGIIKKSRISIIGVILCFVLLIVLILFGERVIFDLNRVANPIIVESVGSSASYSKYSYQTYSYERSGLSSQRIYYKKDEQSKYRIYKLLIHSAFIIPIFLLIFLFYYLFHLKQANPNTRIVLYAYIGAAFWMMLHLLIETAAYVIDRFENAAVYIILGILIAIITPLAIFIQKKVSQHYDNQTNQ